MPSLFDHSLSEIEQLLADEPSYRAKQLWAGIYEGNNLDELTDLPKSLRDRLSESEQFKSSLTELRRSATSDGQTIKWLWQLDDSKAIESVLMHNRDWSTVCISSQAGCAMACTFCATGQMGFDRHLSTGEIVEQVVRAKAEAKPRRLSNVVFMGMGEPMANFDRVWSAVERIHGDVGLSARHLTISTVGVVPGIRKLTEAPLPVNLALSLHGADEETRNSLVPLGKTYPLDMLIDACEEYVAKTHRRLSIEWALIDNVNDRDHDARLLSVICKRLKAHVNLIPLNPTPGYLVQGSTKARVRAFRDLLIENGVNATVRRTRGTDIDAACGQLAITNRPIPLTEKSPVAN